jgi:hypothetical protein
MKVENENISDVINILDVTSAILGDAYNRLLLDDTKKYHKEYVYCLKSLVKELKQELTGEYFSLEYINEKIQTLDYCARMITIDETKH